MPCEVSQAESLPVQRSLFVAEHCPHWPLDSQAGSAVSLQSASLLHEPPTHWSVAVSHTGREPVHSFLFVAEHSPHTPSGSQAGRAGSVQSASLLHASPQRPAGVSHFGVVPVHTLWLLFEH